MFSKTFQRPIIFQETVRQAAEVACRTLSKVWVTLFKSLLYETPFGLVLIVLEHGVE